MKPIPYGNFGSKKGTRKPRLKESDIEKCCTKFLATKGWRSFKMQRTFYLPYSLKIGEVGMADRLYIRYLCDCDVVLGRYIKGCEEGMHKCQHPNRDSTQVMFIEWKAPHRIPTVSQIKWCFRERERGALALLAGIDFPTTILGFKEWYKTSGL